MGVAGVVKADAYGHGLVPVARRLKAEGAEALAVAVPQEGVLLRRAGLEGPILVMMGLAPGQRPLDRGPRTHALFGGLGGLPGSGPGGPRAGRHRHLPPEVDTGMSRLGVHPEEALDLLERAASSPTCGWEGLASHLATAGEPGDPHAQAQARVFAQVLAEARRQGHALPQASLAGSGGLLAPPLGGLEGHGLVRLGISLYGGLPSPAAGGVARLRGAMRFTSRLAVVKRVPAGSCVSYGCTWEASHETCLGVVAAATATAIPAPPPTGPRCSSTAARPPCGGGWCMNAFMVELTGWDPLPAPGEEVVLLGRSGDHEISADQLGQWAGTIPYEITCSLGAANRREHRS